MILDWLNLIMMFQKWTPCDESKLPGRYGVRPSWHGAPEQYQVVCSVEDGGPGLSVAVIPQYTVMQGQASQVTGVTLSHTTSSQQVADLIPDCLAPMLGLLLSASGGVGP